MTINLSDSEWKLMNHLWASLPRTITELTAAVRGGDGWSKNTVITMLSRLEAKGAVAHEEGGRAKPVPPAAAGGRRPGGDGELPLQGLRRELGPDDERHGPEQGADGGGHRGLSAILERAGGAQK